jgi:hypothetical protein
MKHGNRSSMKQVTVSSEKETDSARRAPMHESISATLKELENNTK